MSSKPHNILVISADEKMPGLDTDMLQKAGFHYSFWPADKQPAAYTRAALIDIILLDVSIRTELSQRLLAQFADHFPAAQFILAVEKNAIDRVLVISEEMAFAVLEKPFSAVRLLIELKNATKRVQMQRETVRLQHLVGDEFKMLGGSPQIEVLRRAIEKAAPTDARVLVSGENGSGKELVAEAIHRASKRAEQPFIKVNCAAIPKTLIESELFGHEKGAFTGAYEQKIGLIEEADGGTLLLDEIGDLSLDMQAKLLRVLQENEFLRVGGTRPIHFDVRVLAATNRNLREAIQQGHFRSDLFFRLNVIPMEVPPLRERGDDVELLAKYFLEKAGRASGTNKRLAKDAIELLQNYRWPGNIRELRNAMERAAIMIEHEQISAQDLQHVMPDLTNAQESKDAFALLDGKSLREKIDDFEKQLLQDAYRHSKGNVSRMARLLKTDRANLHRKLSRYGIR